MSEVKDKIAVGTSTPSKFREARSPEPVEKEKRGVIHWGKDNLYPHELVAWRQDNPIHGGIINQKVTFMTAAGAEITGPEKIVEMLTPMIPEIGDDFETFNGFAAIFRRVVGATDSWTVKHLDFESVRCMKKDKMYAISDDWSCSSQSSEKTNYKELPCISTARYSKGMEFIMYIRVKPKQRIMGKGKKKTLSLCYYPIPTYKSADVSILAGIEQDYFTYSEAINGYKGGTVVILKNGTPDSDAKADAIADKIKKEATDRDKQGGMVVLFGEGENSPEIASFNGNDLDKRYIESNKEIRDKILTAHSVGSPTLFGVKSSAVFGSKEEMETAYVLFTNNYILGRQKFIAESLEWAFERIGIAIKITFNRFVLELTQEASDDNRVLRQLNSMSPLVATKVLDSMTPDEVRALARLLPKQVAGTPTSATPVSQEAMAACTVYIKRYELLSAGVPYSKIKNTLSSITKKDVFSEVVSGDAEAIASALCNMMVIHRLSTCGVKRSEHKVLTSRKFDYKSTDEQFLAEYSTFDGLTPVQVKILKLIKDGKSWQEVSKALGRGALYTTTQILKLQIGGYIKGWKVVEQGKPNIEVRYSYEVKPGLGPALISTSRDFCVEMIGLDRLYTRAEIDALGTELDMDIWRYRGGWYHNPNTGKTTRACRHEWSQNIVSR